MSTKDLSEKDKVLFDRLCLSLFIVLGFLTLGGLLDGTFFLSPLDPRIIATPAQLSFDAAGFTLGIILTLFYQLVKRSNKNGS